MKKIILPPRITAEFLATLNACKEEIARFRRAFPLGARVTKSNVARASKLFDIQWLSDRIELTTACSKGRCWCGKRHLFKAELFARAYADKRAKQRAAKKAAKR